MTFKIFKFIVFVPELLIFYFQYNEYAQKIKKLNTKKVKEVVSICERDIVMILGKIKAKLVRNRIDVYPFLKEYDCHNEKFISRENFERGISTAGILLTNTELGVLMDV